MRAGAVLCALLPMLPGALAAETEILEATRYNVRIVAESEIDGRNWRSFASRCAADVDRFLGSPPTPDVTLVIIPAKERGPAGANPFRLVFTPADTLPEIVHATMRSLLLRHADPGEAPVPTPSMEWIAAALTNRFLFGNREILGRLEPDYQPARELFRSGVFPDAERLLTLPVSPDKGVLYRWYALHCDLFAVALVEEFPDAAGPSPFLRLLDLERRGRDPVAAASDLLSRSFGTGEELQQWYERVIPKVSRRGRRATGAADVARRLDELITVPVVAPGRSANRIDRIPIEELPDRLEDRAIDGQAIGRSRAEIYELMKDAPYLLRDPLLEYVDAFGLLAEGKTRRFKRTIRSAHRAFREAMDKQERLDEYLDEFEAEALAPAERYGLYLDVLRRYRLRGEQSSPELTRYLDSLER